MTMLTAPPAKPFVLLTLDSTPPVVDVEVPASVEPPDTFVVRVHANEPLGPSSVVFTDSLGVQHAVGYVMLDDTTLIASIGSMEFSTGAGTLMLLIRDLACNQTVVRRVVTIDRPRPFDVTISIVPSFEVRRHPMASYLVDVEPQSIYATDIDLERGA